MTEQEIKRPTLLVCSACGGPVGGLEADEGDMIRCTERKEWATVTAWSDYGDG